LIVASGFLCLGAALLIDAFGRRRKRRSLLERLKPCQKGLVADEAECWLREQS
jgi:hypothetical protein